MYLSRPVHFCSPPLEGNIIQLRQSFGSLYHRADAKKAPEDTKEIQTRFKNIIAIIIFILCQVIVKYQFFCRGKSWKLEWVNVRRSCLKLRLGVYCQLIFNRLLDGSNVHFSSACQHGFLWSWVKYHMQRCFKWAQEMMKCIEVDPGKSLKDAHSSDYYICHFKHISLLFTHFNVV